MEIRQKSMEVWSLLKNIYFERRKQMTTMQDSDWDDIQFFKKSEFSHPDKMEFHFINRLDQFRKAIGKPIIILSSYRNDPKSQHSKGIAVDVHIKGISLLCAYILACESGFFGGIGVYTGWNNPGLHLDMRPERARWACKTPTGQNKEYIPLDFDFIKELDKIK